MENAAKALLISAGVLVGILILSLMVTLFSTTSSLSKNYDKIKESEMQQQFNSNFMKYLEKDLTIHEVLTIVGFAGSNDIKTVTVTQAGSFNLDKSQISEDLKEANDKYETGTYTGKVKIEYVYKMEIVEYDSDGYVKKIHISNRSLKETNIT